MDKKRTSPYKGEWNEVFKKLPWILLLPIAYGLSLLAQKFPETTEKLYGFVYPYISAALGFVYSFAKGVSVAELLIYIGIAVILVLVIIRVSGLLLGRLRFARFVGFLLSLCITAGILLNIFYFSWGFNYSRPSLYVRMELPVENRPVEELEALCYKLAEDASALRAEINENENGVFALEEGYEHYFRLVPDAYEKLGKKEALFSHDTYPAKPVFASVGMSYAGISGIFIPFTGEANVNVDQPPLLLLSAAAHETAHYLGIAREDEANFVGYLACINSSSPEIAYSGVMLALIKCTNKLYSSNKDLYYGVRAKYSEGMLRDLADYNAYWQSFEGPIEEAATNLNDNYLKFNQQDDGVKSYGMMVDLLLAYYSA